MILVFILFRVKYQDCSYNIHCYHIIFFSALKDKEHHAQEQIKRVRENWQFTYDAVNEGSFSWWRHVWEKSVLLAGFEGTPPIIMISPKQVAINMDLWWVFVVSLKRLSNKSSCRWYETPGLPCYVTVMYWCCLIFKDSHLYLYILPHPDPP